MQTTRLTCAAALALAGAACGGGDSDNVMAPSANLLDPEQVDRALGPEITNTAVENSQSANGVAPAGVAETDDQPGRSAPDDPPDGAKGQARPNNVPEDDMPDEAPPENSVEEGQ